MLEGALDFPTKEWYYVIRKLIIVFADHCGRAV
jgi:hypothetical protein